MAHLQPFTCLLQQIKDHTHTHLRCVCTGRSVHYPCSKDHSQKSILKKIFNCFKKNNKLFFFKMTSLVALKIWIIWEVLKQFVPIDKNNRPVWMITQPRCFFMVPTALFNSSGIEAKLTVMNIWDQIKCWGCKTSWEHKL